MAYTQTNRQGFDKSEVQLRSKASARERRKLMIRKIREMGDERRVQKAAQQSLQGQWMSWQGTLQGSLTWNDVKTELRNTLDVCSPTIRSQSGKMGEVRRCRMPLCSRRQTLDHVLSACGVTLGQGWYTWGLDKALKELAAVVDVTRLQANMTIKTQPEPKCGGSQGQSGFPEVVRESVMRQDIVLHERLTKPAVLELAVPWGIKDRAAAGHQAGEI